MPIKETRIVEYELTGVPGFEATEDLSSVGFSEVSEDVLNYPAAVAYAASKGGVLWSVREGMAFRIEANGRFGADERQRNRATGLYFRDPDDRQRFWIAVDDSHLPEENLILSRVHEGYDARVAGQEWILPKSDALVKRILDRAAKSGRVTEANIGEHGYRDLETLAVNGVSPFGSQGLVRISGGDMAEPYAAMWHSRGCIIGREWELTPERLDKHLGIDDVLIRPVGLGIIDFYGSVVADGWFDSGGRARGVRGAREFSMCRES